ncbi:MAG TPA: DUF3363 domain-containing protein [Asticcacaulis sp.]|nr:DUF3363 domain-containing protein [Asticcacaulis sp.]
MAKLDVTRHDRALVQLASGEGELVLPPEPPDRYADLTARLRQLERWRLAVPIKPGHWRLESDLEAQLFRLGRDETLRRQAQYELTRLGHTEADVELHRAVAPDVKIVGKLLYQGLIDEDEDRRLLLLDGVDGHVHAIDAGQIPLDMAPERGSVLELTGRRAELRSVDRTIARIAAQNGGIYSLEAHLDADPTASDRFAGTHVRRLEALRRNSRAVVREPDGAFRVPDDYLDRALAYETRRVTRTPFTIGTLSPLSLERLVGYRGETWLERLPETGDAVGAGIGFGRQVQKALQARRAWLLQEGYATLIDDRVTLRAGALDLLRRQDIQSAGEARARVTGLPYVEIGLGDQVSGVYRERLDLPSGRFAIVERAHDFVLAPWREALESHKGKSIRATVSEGGIDWTIGRGRSRD